jgi:ribosomal-protein-alanine N-acetyltransferase
MLRLTFRTFPTLYTDRLVLRQVRDDDIDEIFTLRSNVDVMKFLDRPLVQSKAEAGMFLTRIAESLEQQVGITWAISLKENPGMIGTIGFWKIMQEHYRAEIGFMLDPEFQQKGLMQESLVRVLNFGFNTIRLHSVEANVNPANLASIRLLEKNHFVREAYFKENVFFEGRYLDSVIYSLINPAG